MKKKNSILNIILLVVGVVVLINVLANRFFFRIDLTEDSIYTLHESTEELLKDLEEPITITAYFSEKLPPMYTRLRTEFKNKLDEFASVSRGKIVYEFIDPKDDETIKNEAKQNGVMELQIQVMEKDEATSQLAFMGAVIKSGTEQEVLPVIQSETGMEYSLAKAIKKLTVLDKKSVAILQGHGEPGLQKLQHVYYELESFYNINTVYLNDTTSVLDKYSTLIIIAPTDSFPASHLNQLSDFVDKGNNLMIALNTVGMDETSQFGEKIETGLVEWLQNYNVQVSKDYLVDAMAPTVTLQQQVAPGQMQIIPVKFYYIPEVVNFEDHPITGGIEQMSFQFVSSVSYSGSEEGVTFTPIIKTSEKAGIKSMYSLGDLTRQWTENDFPLSELTIGATLEGKIGSGNASKMVVIGDGDFPVGEQRSAQINPENLNLIVNSVDWLADDTGLIGLRTKGASARPIEELEDSKRMTLKVINIALPLFFIICIGIFRRIRSNSLQNKRREEGYV